MIDMRTADVKKGLRENGERYIEISDKHDMSAESVKIAFDSDTQFKTWGLVFVESIKSDQQLYEM